MTSISQDTPRRLFLYFDQGGLFGGGYYAYTREPLVPAEGDPENHINLFLHGEVNTLQQFQQLAYLLLLFKKAHGLRQCPESAISFEDAATAWAWYSTGARSTPTPTTTENPTT